MSRSANHRAMTLLELLVSLAILGSFVVMCGSWLITTARASAESSRKASEAGVLDATVQLLGDDLFEMRDESLSISGAEDELSFVSSHAPAGQRPGWTRIVWHFEGKESSIIRSSIHLRTPGAEPLERIVATGIDGFDVSRSISEDDASSTLAIVIRLKSGEKRVLRQAAPHVE